MFSLYNDISHNVGPSVLACNVHKTLESMQVCAKFEFYVMCTTKLSVIYIPKHLVCCV